MTSEGRKRLSLAAGAALLVSAAAALFATFWMLDFYLLTPPRAGAGRLGPLALLLELDVQTLQSGLAGLSQVIVAVLGIAITVVSIVVQLAATRYTSRIADLFFRDRTNLAIMGFFVLTCIDAVWVSLDRKSVV